VLIPFISSGALKLLKMTVANHQLPLLAGAGHLRRTWSCQTKAWSILVFFRKKTLVRNRPGFGSPSPAEIKGDSLLSAQSSFHGGWVNWTPFSRATV